MHRALSVFALATLAACSHAPDGTGQSSPQVAEPTAPGVVIATVVTHDAKVSILGGRGASDELRVIVRKMDGTLVADGITVEQLRDRDPALHAIVTNATASRGTYLDATLMHGL